MATTTASRKAKGRKLQQLIRDKILLMFHELTENDVQSTPMGVSGIDVQLSEAARKKFPYAIESKNQEKLNIWSALEQSAGDNRDLTPLLIFKRNRSEVYCALRFDDFMSLIEQLDNKL